MRFATGAPATDPIPARAPTTSTTATPSALDVRPHLVGLPGRHGTACSSPSIGSARALPAATAVTGLGLSIVRAIATAPGATITAEPRPGGGLAIDVAFPRQSCRRPVGRMPDARPAQIRG